MTYRGYAFNSILDMELAVECAKANIKCYEAKQKMLRLSRSSQRELQEIDIIINVYRKYLQELEAIVSDIVDYSSNMAFELKDMELKVFLLKFCNGYSPQDIMNELSISKTTYYKICSNIDEKVNATESGRNFREVLQE